MSATALLSSSSDLRDSENDSLKSNDKTATTAAISALLQCRSALTNQCNPKIEQIIGGHQFDYIFWQKFQRIDKLRAIQDFSHIVNTHLTDLDNAFVRAGEDATHGFAVEQMFLQIQSHPSNSNIDAYLDTYSVQLWNALMPNHLPDTLIHAILTPVIRSTTKLMSTPWVVHSLIIEISKAPLVGIDLNMQLLDFVRPNGTVDNNPFIRDLLYRLGSRSRLFRLLHICWSPFDKYVAILINRILGNILTKLETIKLDFAEDDEFVKSSAKGFRDYLLSQSHYDPGFEEQRRLRKEAMRVMPKVFGSSVLSENTFDFYLVNQRFIVAILDLTLELFQFN